ncbi:MAG: hypothetical protein DSY87_00480 [Methylococcus sp.]|nr:MAG: hypothetical protein DSY87_00480 [Methylococcus sp.]
MVGLKDVFAFVLCQLESLPGIQPGVEDRMPKEKTGRLVLHWASVPGVVEIPKIPDEPIILPAKSDQGSW